MTPEPSDMSRNDAAPRSSKAAARTWMLVPVGLLAVSVSGWLVMVSIAVDDPGFSVESDYYKKAAHYDDVMSQRSQNHQLGWSARILEKKVVAAGMSSIELRFADAKGIPLSSLHVEVEAFAVARGQDIRRTTLLPLGEGRYRLELDHARPGLWDIRLVARRDEDVFSHELRVELTRREEPPS